MYSEATPKQVTGKLIYLHSLSSGEYSCTMMPYLTMLLRATYFKLNLTFMVVSVVSIRMRVDWSGVKTSIDTWACRTEDSGGVPWSETDTVMLNRRRFSVFTFFMVDMAPVLAREMQTHTFTYSCWIFGFGNCYITEKITSLWWLRAGLLIFHSHCSAD